MTQEPKAERITLKRAHPTIATIAAQMGLSRATVTHVLNGRAAEQRISPETQQRVLKVAYELGYRANAAARAIRASRFGNIALIQSLHGEYLPGELLHGLTKAIAAKDMHLVLTQVPDKVIDEESYLPRTMRELSVDGVFINRHTGFSASYLDFIHRLGIPVVSLNVKQEFDCVHPDDLMGGRIATEFLLRLGHERIAYVDTDDPDSRHFSKQDRRLGYEQVMLSAGKQPHMYLLPKHWQTPEDQRVEAALRLLAQKCGPTAIVAYELAEAMAIIHAAHLLGRRIPQIILLIHFHHGLDDRFFVPIQTVNNAMTEVGVEAVEMLQAKIANPSTALPTKVVPVHMMEGATCLPYRG